MKIDKVQFGATIPVVQYGNIMPSIEMSDVSIEDAEKFGLKYIKDLFAKYSEKGALEENDIILSKLTKKSFNEGIEIEFEPINHDYFYKGKKLISVTEYVKKFYKPFDADTVSSILESKWTVPQKVIRDLWDANGELTSIFGDVVHKALEYFEKFKSYGEIISSQKKEDENYCLPKHPILRKIIKEFLELKKPEGEVVTEALVSNVKKGICGRADKILIIDKKKKICRVQDYKINVNSEKKEKSHKVLKPFDELPSNKLSKYQIQMSIYANLLQASGWSVVGLDVFVYEDTWKYFEFPVLKVIE